MRGFLKKQLNAACCLHVKEVAVAAQGYLVSEPQAKQLEPMKRRNLQSKRHEAAEQEAVGSAGMAPPAACTAHINTHQILSNGVFTDKVLALRGNNLLDNPPEAVLCSQLQQVREPRRCQQPAAKL